NTWDKTMAALPASTKTRSSWSNWFPMATAAGWNARRASRSARNEDFSGVKYMSLPTVHRRGRTWLSGVLVLLLLAFASAAVAATTLESVEHEELPGGRVQLTLGFNGPVPQPNIFSTTEPPRIAVDFADTSNGVGKKREDIGIGATSGLTVVSAGGRTRLVVDLLRPASYHSQ